MSIYDDLPERPTLLGVWRGTIARAPTSLYDTVDVLLEAYDNTHRFGPCKWGPREGETNLPGRGDWCIVVFDEQNRPYVIGWWP